MIMAPRNPVLFVAYLNHGVGFGYVNSPVRNNSVLGLFCTHTDQQTSVYVVGKFSRSEHGLVHRSIQIRVSLPNHHHLTQAPPINWQPLTCLVRQHEW